MSSISLVSSPITCKVPPQQGQLLSSTSITTSTRGRCAGRAPRLRRQTPGGRGGLLLAATSSRTASAAATVCSRSSRPSWSWSGSSRSERRPNRPPRQLPDQEPQLLDLGLRRIMLGAKGVPLGQDSIAFDLENSVPRALGDDDFRH